MCGVIQMVSFQKAHGYGTPKSPPDIQHEKQIDKRPGIFFLHLRIATFQTLVREPAALPARRYKQTHSNFPK